jgi:hypothetical protein
MFRMRERVANLRAALARDLLTSVARHRGYQEVFLRIQLEFRAAALRALVDLALPGK